ncbi:MAG: cation diffusion facilitator family transporter [Clostridia bacterium]|jgi:divalent metal cation (Fe/Co/Zn/Cd) transporter|nr:cation diffusion facilitator family transporter [Clostridia bacterium]
MEQKDDYKTLFKLTLLNFLITGVLALGFMTYLYFTSHSLLFLIQVVSNIGSTVVLGMYALVLKRQADNKSYEYEYGLGKFEALGTFAGFIIQDVNLIILAVLSVNDFIHADREVSFGVLEFAYPITVVIYDVVIIMTLKRKSSSNNGIIKSQIVDCMNESLQLMVSLVIMTLICLFPNVMGIYKFQYIICLVIIGYTFYLSVDPIKRSAYSLLDKCTDETVSQKILSALTANYELYQYFETYRTRVSARTTFVDVFIGYETDLTMKEILYRNNKIAEDIKALVPDTIVNCILIGNTAEE